MGNKILRRLVELGHLPQSRLDAPGFERLKLARKSITAVFKEANGFDTFPDKELVDQFVSFVGLVKSDIRSVEVVFEDGRYSKAAEGFPKAFRLYEEQRRKAHFHCYEDQVYDPVKLLLRQPHHQLIVKNRVDHLIVDEAQDMNGIQIALLKILAGERAEVMVVGDEDQSIYDWRGAKSDYLIRGFENDFIAATRYTLPHTFRFGHALSLAASYLISKNANRHPKISISTDGAHTTEITSLALPPTRSTFAYKIQEQLDSGKRPDEIAVLVRTYSLSISLEFELQELGIPYHVYGRAPLFRIPEVSAMVALLQLATGRWKRLRTEDARFMFRNLLNMPTLYLSSQITSQLIDKAMDAPNNLSAIIRAAITPTMKDYQKEQIRDRADLLEIISSSTDEFDGAEAILNRYLVGTDFETRIRKQAATKDEAEAILKNVESFKQLACRFKGTVDEFLDQIDPMLDVSEAEPPRKPHVWIGSIHRAKGAQWPVVFVPGLARGSFPRDDLVVEEIEAERRLCYVAMTRAVSHLYLVHPADDAFQRSIERVGSNLDAPFKTPTSDFLWEMELATSQHAGALIDSNGPFRANAVRREELVNTYFDQFPSTRSWRFDGHPTGPAWPLGTPPAEELQSRGNHRFKRGEKVRHPTFGLGVFDSWIDDSIYRVVFEGGDNRTLVARYAPLELA